MLGYRGKWEVVAPTSAPILQMVDIPVQLRVSTPDPEYSMMNPGAAPDGKKSGKVEDHILGSDPVTELAGETHAEDLGRFQLPGCADESLYGIRTADADGDGITGLPALGEAAVGSKHHQARLGIVFQHGLVDDTGTRGPKVDAIFLPRRLEEIEHLLVCLDPGRQIVIRAFLADDQVVAMNAWQGWPSGGRLQDMNCRRAIWAEASCMLTRSGLSFRLRIAADIATVIGAGEEDSSALSRWLYRIFSARVNGRAPRTPLHVGTTWHGASRI